jgi:TRAP-type uncharacterized transport system substrate-binding protein
MRVFAAIRIVLFSALIAAAGLGGQALECLAQTRPSVSPGQSADLPQKDKTPGKEAGLSESRYTVGLVTGAPHSTEFSIAQEIATSVANGQETGPHGEVALRVMPMVGNGGMRNIRDVLSLAGADMAIAPVILADRVRDARTFGDIRDKLVYITPLFLEEFHLLARSEIRSLTDLAGRRVNLGEEGSASAVLGREVLNGLNVKISESNLGLEAALDGMQKGQIFATLLVSGKPVDFLVRSPQANGLHFLPIPYSPALRQDYLPSTLHHDDYPDIIQPGESVDTIAVKSALFAYNWPVRSERFRLLEFFVQTLFSRLPEFRGESHHPKWREVNLAALLPGWQRFRPAERWLQHQPGGETALRDAFGRFLERNSSGDVPDRERLFQEFLRWRERTQGK